MVAIQNSPFTFPFGYGATNGASTPAIPPEQQQALAFLLQAFAPTDGFESSSGAPAFAPQGQQNPLGDMQLLIAILQMLWNHAQQNAMPAAARNAGQMPGGSFANGPTPTSWNGGGPSSSSPGAAAQPVRAAETTAAPPGTQARAEVPWISQFDSSRVERAGNVACYRACVAMMRAAGFNQPAGTGNRIQVATAEDGNGRVSVSPDGVAEGRGFIDRELDAGRPVTIGVSYKDAAYNVDNITDHFVVVNGRGVDDQGRTFYTFHDPGSRNGQDLKLYVDASSGNLVALDGKAYEMSMVVPANGAR